MYNQLQRLNSVVTFALTVAFVLMGVVSFTSLYQPLDASANVKVKGIRLRQGSSFPDYYNENAAKSEYVHLAMDIDADLTKLFHWNTKQVFLMLVAEYETPKMATNQLVLWDTIVQSPEDAQFKLRKYRNKYHFNHFSRKFDTQSANLTFYWDITPHIGLLQRQRQGKIPMKVTLPPLSYK
ncbi:Signal peptidase complex subunit [Dispira parvispora]|uniref:Signal peptidase subunit 3 n=1 Tax=Dispira parvispora TaxID=1520584 RepID=A0A9W8AR40_9FUNG|nr:Signal peptidase complex subunit [Dispira parvispora]